MGQKKKRFLHWTIVGSVAVLTLIVALLLMTGALTAHADEPIEYYGRNGLDALDGDTNNLVGAYDLLLAGLTAKEATISMDTSNPIPTDDLADVMEAIRNDRPELYFVDYIGGYTYSYFNESATNYVYSVNPTYADTLISAEAAAAFEAGIQELMTDAHLKSGMTQVEKEKALHDALCRKVTYNLTATNAHSAYGAIVDGQAVCEGYARAFQLLLNRVGMSSHVVTGMGYTNSGSEAHAWNLVKIGSDYCYTDVTWDDQTEPGNLYDGVFYGYFNISYDMIHEDHVEDIHYAALPAVTTDAYSFFNLYPQSGAVVNQTALPSALATTVANLLKTNGSARLYVTGGNKSDIDDSLWTWYTSNHGSVASALGVSGLGYTYGYSYSGREMHLTMSFVESEKALTTKLTNVQGILSGDLSVAFIASVAPQHGDKLRLRVFYNGSESVLEPASVEGRTCTFRFDGIAPHHMGDRLDVELFVYAASGGEPIALDGTKGFTFKNYCNQLLTKTASELDLTESKKAALDQLLKDLLVYGGACQTYTGYDTAHPVDAGITGSSFTALDSPNRSDTDSTDPGIAKAAYSVWFDCANKIMMYYNADDPSAVKVFVDDVEVTPVLEGSRYLVMTDAVLATQLDALHTFELRKGSETVQALRYSVQAYVYALQNHSNEIYRNLVRTLYNYGKSCNAYKSAS